MKFIDIVPLRESIESNLKNRIDVLKSKGINPCLAIIMVGDNSASASYVRTKKKLCEKLGIQNKDYHFDENVKQADVINKINELNKDKSVHSILVQLPLPKHLDTDKIIDTISPEKDADGISTYNLGLCLADKEGVFACTPKGIIRILEFVGVSLKGKNVCIINRSKIVGRPLAAELISHRYNATVFSCNTHTQNLNNILKISDIVVTAVGKYGFINSSTPLKKGAVIVDVSINRIPDASTEKGYRVCGDVDYTGLEAKDLLLTKVPGGVGIMTVQMLADNTVYLCEKLSK